MDPSFISDDTLLGYVLGALEPAEQQVVAEALARDPQLQYRLKTLQALISPLEQDDDLYEPPGSMVSDLMATLQSTASAPQDATAESTSDGPSKEILPSREPAVLSLAYEEKGRRSAWGAWIDVGVSCTACVIGLCLVGPAIVQSRESSRAASCAHGLAVLSQHIRDFAFRDRGQRIPEVPVKGPLAFAGVYAIQLNDAGILEDTELLWCPSALEEDENGWQRNSRRLPSAREIRKLSSTTRRIWSRLAGGSYAYNLGFIDRGQHITPSIDDHCNVAVLADAPVMDEKGGIQFATHQNSSSNVLYEDGRVRMIRIDDSYDGPDHPYLNREGKMEAGVDAEDSAMGSSSISPLGLAR